MNEPLPGPTIFPHRGELPVLLSVPHAGRDYPGWLIELARGGRRSLQPLEDPLVDRLVWRALGHGIGAVVARTPRAAVDCNRAEDEIDPAYVHGSGGSAGFRPPSPRARGGLGIVPSRTALHGHLWRRTISRSELDSRLEQAHRPYHRAVNDALGEVAQRFGCALLLDCHSMPSLKGGPQIVFGDRFGRSAAPWLTSRACAIAADLGFTAAANEPFAGGHVVERHGEPQESIHALQVEVDRACYLTPNSEPGPRFDRIACLIEQLAVRLGGELLDHQLPAAAE